MASLFKRGDTVNIFQMSVSKGLLFEGRALVVRACGHGDGFDEHYMVEFEKDIPRYPSGHCPTYERFIDRDGQEDAQAYIKAFNKRIGYAA